MASVFLSYDRDDGDVARHFARALEKAGHSVWWDLHVRGGAQFGKVIEEALKAADAVVVLWSKNSIESAWVKDEAAAGRDSGRLVPVTIDGTEPPLGFRQFQTIDLKGWKGRGTPPPLKTLMNDIEALAGRADAAGPPANPPVAPEQQGRAKRWLVPAAAALLLLVVSLALWQFYGRSRLPVVEVMAANSSSQSQAVASDLFVKLGSLAQVGKGKWQLVDASSGEKNPDLIFRTADTSSGGKPQVNLVLLDGGDGGLLWSREFNVPNGTEADLRQQLSLTAGRVLGCALETREAGGLKRDLLKLFLNACALISEASTDDPVGVSESLRTVVSQQPSFTPAWSRLLLADLLRVDLSVTSNAVASDAIPTLRADLAKARKVDPDLPEITLGEVTLLPPGEYGERLRLLDEAAKRAPDSVPVLSQLVDAFAHVGRMGDAVQAAERTARLDPLSPAADTQLIMTLAYAGRIDAARAELARVEKIWAGTGALRDVLWAFHLRFGDPTIASSYVGEGDDVPILFLQARRDPSPANIQRLAAFVMPYAAHPRPDYMAFSTQALAPFNLTDDVFTWINNSKTADLSQISYIFFRPAFDKVRRDTRFMAMARRIGLADYWLKSGKWPDYCEDPTLPYDCKSEAAKHG